MDPVETYLRELSTVRSSGAAVAETSYYPPLANLLNEIGKRLKPKVRCILNIRSAGAGLPDGGLFTADQFQKGPDAGPIQGRIPSRGVIEVKGTGDDAWVTAQGEQVSRYWGKYRQVLVTNYRDFVLVGQDSEGKPARLETYRLAPGEAEFWAAAAHPRKMAAAHARRLTEYLGRVLVHGAPLAAPKDVAWLLASYARDALARVEAADLPALDAVRRALEDALGLRFEGPRGEHFFRSSLVQTLFYGVFSAWVLWSKSRAGARFNWREAAWSLRVPMIRTLFEQVATPSKLGPLALDEVLDWVAAALDRVDRPVFFERFAQGEAVQYFYEPFLEAFDPELRKQLGVWYTPPEVVRYMVARVDAVLREELDIPDGLADGRVYVLDPCCGTGAYLAEVLRRIARGRRGQAGDALAAQDVKRAAMERVFGFELLPAPFVVAHLQLGLLLQDLGAPLSEKKDERAGIYLTNALTGWEPPKGPKSKLIFPEMEEEREAAEKVKRDVPVLVVLGNPPYNGYAGVAVEEDRDLSDAYRTTRRAAPPQGQGLNDLYVRFFRMAERRIVERTGRGIVCFISNYSWLDGLSFPGMRERYLDVFDKVWIDCLNGDKYKTGKLTPEGEPDPSVFSTELNREGIQVGTAIALMVRREKHRAARRVAFRHFWGKAKRAGLAEAAERTSQKGYQTVSPATEMGLPFMPGATGDGYFTWPPLPDLFPVNFPGVKTSRDALVVDVGRDRLGARMRRYFDEAVSDETVREIAPVAMTKTAAFDPKAVRRRLVKRGFRPEQIVPYCYRPFDVRWLYWEPETNLLDRKRDEYRPHVAAGNVCLVAQQKPRRAWSPPQVIRSIGCLDLMDRGASCFPLLLHPNGATRPLLCDADREDPRRLPDNVWINLSDRALEYTLRRGGMRTAQDLFFHALAVLHSPVYARENSGALRQDWPRVPLPDSAKALAGSVRLGRRLAALLDVECAAAGVTAGKVRPEWAAIGAVARAGGGPLDPEAGDLDVTAGWGHAGQGGVVMPAQGKVVRRDYAAGERGAIARLAAASGTSAEEALAILGRETCDVYLNAAACWRNVPAAAWEYAIGGYQVLKKWLSYREKPLLGRGLTPEEARQVSEIIRRIAAILLLGPALDANFRAVKDSVYAWPGAGVAGPGR